MDSRKRDALEAIYKAIDKVEKLCHGEERWRLSIPARPDYDPDILIMDALHKACALLTAEPEPCKDAHYRIYVASSWKNEEQPGIVRLLRSAGHEVYDFRHPKEDDDGFSWSEIDPNWKNWTAEQYLKALDHPAAQRGFGLDWSAMEWADTGVLVLPCGKSAHLEAGYFVGARKSLFILMVDQDTPELMYKMATKVCTSEAELASEVQAHIAYASQVADKRAEEEQAAHEVIASICFEAGVETPDGTSVGAVRNLAKLAEGLREQLTRATDTLEDVAAQRNRAMEDVETLREAISDAIQSSSTSYKDGRGRSHTLEGDDGEQCYILCFDGFNGLEQAFAATEPKPCTETGKAGDAPIQEGDIVLWVKGGDAHCKIIDRELIEAFAIVPCERGPFIIAHASDVFRYVQKLDKNDEQRNPAREV